MKKSTLKTKTMNFRMPLALWRKFKKLCLNRDLGCAEVMRSLVSEHVNENKVNK